jgi:hypothetical protein
MDYGLNQVCFWSDQMLRKAFSLGWRIVDLSRTDRTDELSAQHAVHSEWRLIAVKEA